MHCSIIALAGNPNCGKTALFNILTGNKDKTGNRAGVTVAVKTAPAKNDTGISALIADLPGIYSLAPSGNEEKTTDEYLRTSPPDAVINVLDSTNLARGIFLTTELTEKNIPMILALNMSDEAEKEGIKIDTVKLSSALGCPVFLVSAVTKQGISELCSAVSSILKSARRPRCFSFDGDVSRAEFAKKLSDSVTYGGYTNSCLEDKLDAFICRTAVGIPLFFIIMMLVFALTFSSAGTAACKLAENLFSSLTQIIAQALSYINVNEALSDFIIYGILSGIGAVISFLPRMIILFALLEILEDSGYLSRAAFAMDAPMRAVGLSGKAFIPFITGFGCTVPAILSARILKKEERENVILSLPFIPCGARMPIFSLIVGSFFEDHKALASFGIYALGIFVSVFSLIILSRGRTAPALSFELPKYRPPKISNIFRVVSEKVSDFISKAGGIIFLSSAAVYILSYLTPNLRAATNPNESILACTAKLLSPLMRPLGLDDFRICAALISGLFAKEAIVSTIFVLGIDISRMLTEAQAISLAVFALLYSPCFAAMSACRCQIGTKKSILLFFRTLLFAYAFAFIAYTSARIFAALL